MDVSADMARLAKQAVEGVRPGGGVLDYTLASLVRIDQILDGFHQQQRSGWAARLVRRMTGDADIKRLALTFGAYLGETIRREFDGSWLSAPGPPTLLISRVRCYPIQQAYNRICDGDSASLLGYIAQIRLAASPHHR